MIGLEAIRNLRLAAQLAEIAVEKAIGLLPDAPVHVVGLLVDMARVDREIGEYHRRTPEESSKPIEERSAEWHAGWNELRDRGARVGAVVSKLAAALLWRECVQPPVQPPRRLAYDRLTAEQIHELASRLPVRGDVDDGSPCEHGRTSCVLCGHGLSIDQWARALPEPRAPRK